MAGKKRFGLPDQPFRPTIEILNKVQLSPADGDETREQALHIKEIRRWWQIKTGRVDTPLDGDMPFWMISFFFHVALLVALAAVIIPNPRSKQVSLVLDPTPAVEVDTLPPEIEFEDDPADAIGADSEFSFQIAADMAPEIDTSEDAIDIDLQIEDRGELLTDDDLFDPAAETMSTLAVKGSVGQSVTGAAGAVDRITQEIMHSLDERKTLVVWMFDQSASLMQQRDAIAARFDHVYEELGMLEAAGSQEFTKHRDVPLLTQIVAFGEQTTVMLDEPTSDVGRLKEVVAAIDVDRSGIENVFSAVIRVAELYKHFYKTDPRTKDRYRNVMIIIVSDEAGDDGERIDECVQLCTRFATPVFVIGVPAPFGRKETQVKWVDPDPAYDQSPQLATVTQGPESMALERIRLDFTGNFEDLDMIDSGFGPFNLTRLCYETGGIYFAVHPNRTTSRAVRMWETANYSAYLSYFFDPKVMRPYKPDYVSRATYLKRLEENKSRSALVQAAMYTTTGVLDSPRLRFPNLDEASFVRLVSTAQQAAARVEPQLDRLYEILRAGEEDRNSERSPRWQAGYDLAYGRTMAAKVRASSYNQMLAMAKTTLKFTPPQDDATPANNTWILRPDDNIETGSQQEKMAAKAREILQRVVDSHPGTPWAMLAARELETPIGWTWMEGYTPPPEPRTPRPDNNNNVNRPNPQPRENAMPKEKRKPPRL